VFSVTSWLVLGSVFCQVKAQAVVSDREPEFTPHDHGKMKFRGMSLPVCDYEAVSGWFQWGFSFYSCVDFVREARMCLIKC